MKENTLFKKIKMPLIIGSVFWIIAVLSWQTRENIFLLLNFGYLGTSLFIGISSFKLLPQNKKKIGRYLTQGLIGIYLLGYVGIYLHENIQIEGFILSISAGIFGAATIHYLIAKIIGPIIFNRGWCGWACWTVAILDLLPYKRNKNGRLSKKWEYGRYLMLALTILIVIIAIWGYGYQPPKKSISQVYWLLVGNTIYYIAGITLAIALKDNRAFCKYLCPISVIMKPASSIAKIRISGDAEECKNCGLCNKNCPMDINISEYIKNNERVTSTECVVCMNCTINCPSQTLTVSLGSDSTHCDRIRRRNN